MADASFSLSERFLSPVVRRYVALATRWPGLTAGALGIIAALGFPPLHAWWIALPALALFVAHLRAAPDWKSATWRGWVFGWAHLTLANNWIATAFTHQAKMPEFLGWLAVPLLCIYLALYPALAALVAHFAARRAGPLAYGAVLAAAWIITEWLRSWVFTGYPWPPLGLMLLGDWKSAGLAASLPYLGTYGLSGAAVFIAGVLLWLSQAKRFWFAAIFAALLSVRMIFPVIMISPPNEGVRYTLVQPLILQDEINDA